MSNRATSLLNRVIYFTLKDTKAATRLTDHLIKTPNERIILPFIDHPGPISDELLRRKFKSLIVCERDETIRQNFQTHVDLSYAKNNIKIYNDDVFDLLYKISNDSAQQRCSNLVQESMNYSDDDGEQSRDDEKKIVKFLIPLLKGKHEAGLLRNLYYQMSLRIGLCSNTFVHYYFLMSERQFNYLDAKPGEKFNHYRSTTILYNTLFKIHKLDTFDLASDFKLTVKKLQNTVKTHNSSYQKVFMILLEPRLNILNSLDARSLVEFRFLINQVMHRRRDILSEALEKWFDNCSQDLEQFNITKESRSGDLTFEQYYQLFKYLKGREDYPRSIFLQAAACADDNILHQN